MMEENCRFLGDCRLPYDMCNEECDLYQEKKHSYSNCKDPKHCSICEDEGYGDFLKGQAEE